MLDWIQQCPAVHSADDAIALEEVQSAVMSLAPHKAPGIDGIPVEVYQKGSENFLTTLFELQQ